MHKSHLSKSRYSQQKTLPKDKQYGQPDKRREVKSARKNSAYSRSQKKKSGVSMDSDDFRNTNIHESQDPSIDNSELQSYVSEEALLLDNNALLDITQDLPIKKPQSAYVIFGKMKRDQIMRQNPGIKVTEVVKQIAKLWQSLSKEEKQRYKEAAKQDKERYSTELKELTRSNKTLNKPKKPLTPYMLFVRETRPKVVRDNPNIASLDIMKEVGRIWQVISKEELEYFKEKSRVDMTRFKNEHESFINEINELRQKSPPQQIKEEREIEIQQERVPEVQRRPGQIPDSDFPCQSQATSGQSLLQKRSRQGEKDFTLQSSIQETPQKSGKVYSPTIQQQTSPSQQDEEPVSPYMRAKREVARPKKPLSAYIYFSQEYREFLKEEHPDWSSHEIMKHVSARWAHMNKEQKQPYNDMAAEDKDRYDKQLLDFAQANELSQASQGHVFDLRKLRKGSASGSSDADMQQQMSSEMHIMPEQSKDMPKKDPSEIQHDKFLTPNSQQYLQNQHTDETNYRRYQTTPSRPGQLSIFSSNNLSPFAVKPFNHDYVMGSGQRKLFADDSQEQFSDRPYRFDTPMANKFKLFDEQNSLQQNDPFGRGSTPQCKQNLFGDEEMYEQFVQMRGHKPYNQLSFSQQH